MTHCINNNMGNFFSFPFTKNDNKKDNKIVKPEIYKIVFDENKNIIISKNVSNDKTKLIDLNILEKYFIQCGIESYLLEPIFNLMCENISITKIINFPFYILSINCSNNMIENLDDLPENILILNCAFNNISRLDDLPISMEDLNCSHNDLEYLNNLPFNIIQLNCSHNKLVNLDNLPSSIIHLNCYHNYFNELVNYNFQSLTCDYTFKNINQIKPLFDKITSVQKGVIKMEKFN